MRGSININDLFDRYSFEDIKLINEVIKENIKNTTETKLPLL